MNDREAFEALGLSPTAVPAEIQGAWRRLRSAAHPDRGGDAGRFYMLRQAYDRALSAARRPRVCQRCQGSGKVAIGRAGATRVVARCPDCHGLCYVTPVNDESSPF